MIPLRDNVRSRYLPLITVVLILMNALAFLWEISLGPRLGRAMLLLAIIPARYSIPHIAAQFHLVEQLMPFVSSQFLHGGWLHLIGNMWFLWIFGTRVEARFGSGWYLLFYLASGVTAALLHIYTNMASVVPTIGASGAVAGVMGAYFRFYPRARIETIIPPFIFGPVLIVPATLFLGFWFLLQFFNGALGLGRDAFSGIAWWAHVGGFLFGLFIARQFTLPKKRSRDPG